MTEELKAMPHAVGMEKSVLSILMNYPETIDECPDLTAEHFHLPAHRIIFEMIRQRLSAGLSIDLVDFYQALLDVGKLDAAGGPASITECFGYSPFPGNLQRHVLELTKKLARRMAIMAGNEIVRTAYEAAEESEIIEASSAPISAIHDALAGNRESKTKMAVLRETYERWEKLCAGTASPVGMEVSIDSYNRHFKGLRHKHTVVISAYPGEGKTTLAAQLAVDVALNGYNALICSLEMPAEAMMARILAYVSRQPGNAVTDPLGHAMEKYGANGVTVEMTKSVEAGMKVIKSASLEIEDLTGAHVHQITACIRRAHRKKPLDVVVVDFAQRIRATPEMRGQSREQQLAHASNMLADITKELGFCLLLPSQLNKDGAAKHAEAINEDADLHLSIAKDGAGIKVVKDRHHGCHDAILPVVLDGPNLKFIRKSS